MPTPSEYHRPTALEDALNLCATPGSIALAGGALTFTMLDLPYQAVIDLQDIAALKAISSVGPQIVIGGAASLEAVVNASEIPAALKRSLTRTVPSNVRAGASAGESLTAPVPPLEWLAMLAALDCQVLHIAAGESASAVETSPLADFVNNSPRPYPGIITQITIPAPTGRRSLGAAFVARTPADEPIVSAAACVERDDAGVVQIVRVVLAGASAETLAVFTPEDLTGTALTPQSIASASHAISAQAMPVADYRGGVEYRREMAAVCTRRALEACLR